MRSALCAALMLHIFHKYSDRIRIANLAQTINVLQAILLTEGGRLVKTPTYHVFDLFQAHQDADFVPVAWEQTPETLRHNLPHVDLSASVKQDSLTVSLVNLSAERDAEVELTLLSANPVSASGRLISGRPTAHNAFDNPRQVETAPLRGITLRDGLVRVSLPPCAIASVAIQLA